MNQRKLSKLWSSIFAVVMLLVGSSSAFGQVFAVYDQNGTLLVVPGSPFACSAAGIQAAFNAVPANGEVRQLAANCAIGGAVTVNTSQNVKLTAGAGGANLEFTGGVDLNINSGTFTLGSGNNNIDMNISGIGGTINIAAGATFELVGIGNNVQLGAATAEIVNNGAFVTQSPRVAGSADVLGGVVVQYNDNNAPSGLYVNDGVPASPDTDLNDKLSGTGVYGNIFFLPNVGDNEYDVTDDQTINIADNREVVFMNGAILEYTAGGPDVLTFANANNAIDVHFQNESVIQGATDGGMTVQGNAYFANDMTTAKGTLTVLGDLSYLADADYTNTFGTIINPGNFSVVDGAFDSNVAPTVTVWGNVSILDDSFNPALTLSQAPATTSSTTLVATTATTPLTSLTIAAGKTVATATAITTTTMSNPGTLNHSAGTFTATTVSANAGTINVTGGTFASTTVTSNAGSINNSAGTLTLTTVTLNGGTIATSGTGASTITTLTSNTGTVSNSGTSVGITTVTANTGTISNSVGTTTITNFATNAGTVSATGGTLTINSAIASSGTLTRTGGSFVINGNLTNTGAITNSSSTFGGGDYASRLLSAVTDGIQVFGNFTQNNNTPYTGQVIVDANAATRTVNGTGVHGSLGVRSGAFMVTAGANLTVNGSLVLHTGTFNLAAFALSLTNATTAVLPVDTTPAQGIMMAANTLWTNGTVSYNGAGKIGFFQVAAGVPAGSLFVNAGQVQLLSNVHVSNITVAVGATLRKPFNTFCYELVVAGTSTINGAILECGVFAITDNSKSIRRQLLENGYDPDNMNESVQIAIGAGRWISLTDAGAEGPQGLLGPANNTYATWRGVTLVSTQTRFILSSGTVMLNDANLNLRGGFVYAGDWENATVNNRARLLAGSNAATAGDPNGLINDPTGANYNEVFQNNNGGFLNFVGLNASQANFVFVGDGVNNDGTGGKNRPLPNFVIRRLTFDRTGSPIAIVDNNNVNAGNVPSHVVVSEKLLVKGSIAANDNNIVWIGGNNRPLAGSVPANRTLQVATDNLIGTGFFMLANNWISNDDKNTITLLGASASSSTNLQMQFRKIGTAGDRTKTTPGTDALDGIATIGNGGMSYVQAGTLTTNELTKVNGDFTLGQDRSIAYGYPVLNLSNGVTFEGNLFVVDNNASQRVGTGARLVLVPSTGEQKTIVKGAFETGAYYNSAGDKFAGFIQTGGGSAAHNLYLQGSIRFGAVHATDADHATNLGFVVPQPSRVVFNGSATQNLLVGGSGAGVVNTVKLPRFRVEMTGASTNQYTIPAALDIRSNDVYLLNGVLLTNGNLDMYDLAANNERKADGGALSNDTDFSAGSPSNLSIVTRDRSGSNHGQITRGLGSTGAYTSFDHMSVDPMMTGGAPYTVQHIGSESRFSGDEIPGLNVVNAAGNANNSMLQRLVVNVTNGTQFELSKDLIVLTRMEMLSGTLDIVQSAFLDIADDVQWVHGHAVLSPDVVATSVIRFPNMSGNTSPALAPNRLAGGNASGRYDLLYVSQVNHTTGFEYKSGVGVRDLTIMNNAAAITVTLSENKEASGSVRVVDGVLNLDSKTLKITGNLIVDGAFNGNGTATAVNNNGNGMVSGWFPVRKGTGIENTLLNPYDYKTGTADNGNGRIVETNGTLEFVGENVNSYILGYIQNNNKTVMLPNVVVTKTGSNPGAVRFEIDQAFGNLDNDGLNKISVLSFTQNSGRTDLRPGATVITSPSDQSNAPASGANGIEVTSTQSDQFAAGFAAARTQHWEVRQNMNLVTGDFFAWGATMTVMGNYEQGDNVSTTKAVFWAGQGGGSGFASAGQVSLMKQVNGNFTVYPDNIGLGATKFTGDNSGTGYGVHRYYLSNGWLGVAGNYAFDGHADVTTWGVGIPETDRGFRGTIEFNRAASATDLQQVRHIQNFRAFFENVVVNGRGIALSGVNTDHMWVNDRGIFTFKLGNVVTGRDALGNLLPRWLFLQNTSTDSWSANFVVSGAIRLSGSNSYVDGNLRRRVLEGGTSGGYLNTGYIFPLGNGQQQWGDGGRFYRPMTLQFPANLGETRVVTASSTFEERATPNALTVNGVNGNIVLNDISPIRWTVQFDKNPALEPNIRLGAQGLMDGNSSNIDDMRIVTFDANGVMRMAGIYDIWEGTNPDDTFNPNDFIDGLPTFFQEGVDFNSVSTDVTRPFELRIATDMFANPFNGKGDFAYVQVIHNSPAGTVDVTVNGATLLDNFAYQTATEFVRVVANTPLSIDVRTANGATSLLGTPIQTTLEANKSYILIAQGGNNNKPLQVVPVTNARRTSTVSNGMQFFFVHGVTNGPTVNVERVTTSTPRTLEQLIAVNAPYGTFTSYMTQLNPSISTIQLKAGGSVVGQYLFDFGNYAGESMTLLATGAVGGAGANALTIIGVDAAGNVVRPQVTTSDDEDVATELPAEFTLNGNFPNPFNPTTNISFDLPEQANVRVEIVDLLGRQVMTVAPQSMSAGANKVITVDAARLSSGVYFYRVIAEGSTKTFVQGSKFTLVK
jgi:hypothetical protein